MTPGGGAIFEPRGMVGKIYKEDNYTLLHTKYECSGPCGFGEEDFFICFSHDTPRAWSFLTPGARLAAFIMRTTIPCYTQNMKALGLAVSEKIFLCFPHCKSMGANDPRGWTIFDPRGMVGRIYKEDHYTLLHTKYESSGPCGFGEEDFFCFSHDACMDPRGMVGRILLVKKIFLCFSHCKSMGAICCHGNQSSDPTWPKTYHNLSPSSMML